VPDASVNPVLLSTASVYPEPASAAFEIAAALDYDGIEVMVWADPISQDIAALGRLSEKYDLPIQAIHAPCLIISQRVWAPDPKLRLTLARDAALALGSSTVVVHPPFRWQRDYARNFAAQLERMTTESEVIIAVENMYPLRARARQWTPYHPHWDPTIPEYSHYTLDISHAAVARVNPLELAHRMGDRLAHVHLGDGSGTGRRDEHLIPGRGAMPCAEVLQHVAHTSPHAAITVEVSTRSAKNDRPRREADLAETLTFARRYLA
jgi:sugar phosphate isomerase/epimerase